MTTTTTTTDPTANAPDRPSPLPSPPLPGRPCCRTSLALPSPSSFLLFRLLLFLLALGWRGLVFSGRVNLRRTGPASKGGPALVYRCGLEGRVLRAAP